MHAVLTLLTCVWAIVWIIATTNAKPARPYTIRLDAGPSGQVTVTELA
ncbi:MAG: hypothetical protein HOV78_11540 [Hamadaea sp.]|nr:hypothetical protein [Hamadaea sp.]